MAARTCRHASRFGRVEVRWDSVRRCRADRDFPAVNADRNSVRETAFTTRTFKQQHSAQLETSRAFFSSFSEVFRLETDMINCGKGDECLEQGKSTWAVRKHSINLITNNRVSALSNVNFVAVKRCTQLESRGWGRWRMRTFALGTVTKPTRESFSFGAMRLQLLKTNHREWTLEQ